MVTVDEIEDRLKYLSFNPTGDDLTQIEMFILPKVLQHIENFINQDVPEELNYVVIDMVCGEFLSVKKAFNQLGESFSFEATITEAKMGDTSFKFNSGEGAEASFDLALDKMINGHMDDLLRFRKMVW